MWFKQIPKNFIHFYEIYMNMECAVIVDHFRNLKHVDYVATKSANCKQMQKCPKKPFQYFSHRHKQAFRVETGPP